ncbi:DUF1573 domain-containing protein [Mesonia aestuariivivens]|uniref:DUF1573 domain-containing protein n=1 Tax=Mesonia aestuariivivens TaxID=2796128 RepID=A0ABS6W4S4_9FLAO|nr:DUF1573 domain-containing protein [Mesonia aestuariivivens]MBW2962868.1 DUF1573 domain-containing protein [Mesonia aestuariivivens]
MQIKRIIIALLLITTFSSCDKLFNQAEEAASNTTMAFEDPIRHYYPLIRGEKLNVSYKFKNTGAHPLYIKDVQASCSCITTNSFDRPIAVGNYGYITLEFDSHKNIGYVEHHVLVLANVDSTYSNEVKFATNVVPDPLYIKDYEEIYYEQRNTNVDELVEGKAKLRYYIPNESKK